MSAIKLSHSVVVALFSLALSFDTIVAKPRSIGGDALDVVVHAVPSGYLVTLSLGDLSGDVIHQKYAKVQAHDGDNNISFSEPQNKHVTGIVVQVYSSSSQVEGVIEDLNSRKITLNLKVQADSVDSNKNIWYDIKLLSSEKKH